MSYQPRFRWWVYGLVGGFVYALASLEKVVKYLTWAGPDPASRTTPAEIVEFALMLFACGFACGLSLWLVHKLLPKPHWLSDTVGGFIVFETLTICCAIMFEPTWFTTRRAQGMPMFLAMGAMGLVLGPWIGRDVRKELAEDD